MKSLKIIFLTSILAIANLYAFGQAGTKIDLTHQVQNVLPVANGGTGNNTGASAGVTTTSTNANVTDYCSFISANTTGTYPLFVANSCTFNPSTGKMTVTALGTDTILSTDAGVFSTSSNNSPVIANVGGCQPLLGSYAAQNASYYNVQYTTNLQSAIIGCVLDTSSSGVSAQAIFGTAGSTDTGADSVGGAFYGFALANGVTTFGTNPVAQDISGLTSGVHLIAEEVDVQPYNAPSAYGTYGLTGLHIRLFNPTNIGGVYPGTYIELSGGTQSSTTAYMAHGIDFLSGSLGSSSVLLNVNPIATAISGTNYNPPPLFNYYESYWHTGSVAAFQFWKMTASEGNGTDPTTDSLLLGNVNGPTGQTHTLVLSNGIQLELTGSTSGQVFMQNTSAGFTLLVGQTVLGAVASNPVLPSGTLMGVGNNSGDTAIAAIGYNGIAHHSGVRFGGSYASPTAVGSGIQISSFESQAYNGTGENLGGSYTCTTTQAQTTSNGGTKCGFYITPNNSVVQTLALELSTARKGTFVCTSGGTITISNTNEAITSDVIISLNTAGGTISTPPAMKTTTAGTGFTVLCATSDTSTYNYNILN